MNEQRWFETPIWYDQIENYDKQQFQTLIDQILNKSQNDPSVDFASWQSCDIKLGEDIEMDKLLIDVKIKLYQISDFLGSSLAIDKFWINVFGNNQYKSLSNHPGSLISGIIFLDSDHGMDQGPVIFKDLFYFNSLFNKADFPKWFDHYPNSIVYPPKTGNIIMFPSSLTYEIPPNQTYYPNITLTFTSRVAG